MIASSLQCFVCFMPAKTKHEDAKTRRYEGLMPNCFIAGEAIASRCHLVTPSPRHLCAVASQRNETRRRKDAKARRFDASLLHCFTVFIAGEAIASAGTKQQQGQRDCSRPYHCFIASMFQCFTCSHAHMLTCLVGFIASLLHCFLASPQHYRQYYPHCNIA
jgi:hypothetical protein